VAAGVLTPPPVAPTTPDSDETVFLSGATVSDDEATGVGSSETAIDDEATGVGSSETTFDDEATRFEPAPPARPPTLHAHAGAATDPTDADATRFVDPNVTRIAAPSDADETRFTDARPPSRPATPPPAGQRHETFAGTRSGAKTTEGPTGPLEVGQAFSSRYHIIRVLGIGGMGAVYHAWDAELGMAVALKVIRPESSTDAAAAREMERRFKQELVLARQVTHKNVVRIHDLGEIDGIKYITMPYLEGSDLATVLKERGKMPVPEALGIIRDVAAGLSAAHEAGIVHRDLKPANIMVLEDHAVIMDFGIARSSKLQAEAVNPLAPSQALDSLKSAGTSTVAGTILGTVKYMAPEQAKGQAVDQRADIYALGLIFLDMLLGKRHAQGASAIEELKARMEAPPPLAQTIEPTIPKPIEQLIAKCLQPDPEQRYATSADLVAALDRLDAKGELIPIKRTIRLPAAIAMIVLLLGVSVGVWWYQRQFIPPPVHDPVSIVLADFQNSTGDATFDKTLEPLVKLALEGASFVTVYDRAAIRSRLGVQPPEKLNEREAQQLAVQQGVSVVLAGAITRGDRGFDLSVKATRPTTGEVIVTADEHAPNKDRVLEVARELATEVRKALGDDTSDDAQRFAMGTWTASSLEVVHEFALATVALSNTNSEEARQHLLKAVELDPKFGPAYQSLAAISIGLDRQQDAEQYITEALRNLDRMSERERMSARGLFYLITGDYQACIKEYTDMIARFERDTPAQNNLAICSLWARDVPKAATVMSRVVEILPKRSLYRTNHSTFAAYGSDFQTAEQEAQKAHEMKSRWGWFVLAFAHLGQGRLTQAAEAYQELHKVDALGESQSASGLADLAMYQGRFAESALIFEQGVAADLKAMEPERAADKLMSLANVQLLRGRQREAAAAAARALMNNRAVKTRFMAARIFVEVGQVERAQLLKDELAKERLAEPRAYAKILEGLILSKQGNPNQAIAAVSEANELLNTWIGHLDLGKAYLDAAKVAQAAGQIAQVAGLLAQADSEFDRCLKRRGEALSLFLDNEPTYGFLPVVYYYRGQAREGLKTADFSDSYRTYLNIRGQSTEDPLVRDARRRVAN
jgi:serine/threonine protein kinase